MSFFQDFLSYSNIIILVLATILNLWLSFLFSLIETSLIITDDIKFQMMIQKEQNKKRKKRLTKIFNKRDKHGAALSVAITLTNVTGSAVLGSMAAKYLGSEIWLLVFTVLMTYFMLVFARTVPKIYARKVNHKVLPRKAWLIRLIYFISIPILWFTLIWVKILKLNKNKNSLTISELKDIVAIYKKNGVINVEEENLFSHIFTLRERGVEYFISKKEIESFYYDKSLSEYKNEILTSKNKKMFVVNEKNKVIGIVHQRNLIKSILEQEEDKKIIDFMKKAQIIHVNEKLIDIMIKVDKNISQCVFIDEKGIPKGIASMKDLYFHMTNNVNKKKKIKNK